MLFPWVGLLEQVRLADVYVHYDDVQFSKGSFTNRVQLKAPDGVKWLTLPLRNLRLGTEIRALAIDDRRDWRQSHLGLLNTCYRSAPHYSEMIELVERVYGGPAETVSEVSARSIEALNEYFELGDPTKFHWSSALGIDGASTERVLNIVRHFGGDVYITGHGAKAYFDHELLERYGIRTEYVDYQKRTYPQLYGDFTPYVSSLDLIANLGRDGRAVIASGTVHWKDFLAR